MAKIQLLLVGLYATSAFASPWFRNKKRGEWDTTSPGGQPWGYGSTESPAPTSPWGYGTSNTCQAVTVTLPGSTFTERAPGNSSPLGAFQLEPTDAV